MTSWKQLWEWLNAEKVNIPVYQQLGKDTQKWKESKYKSSLLWSESANLSFVRGQFQDQIEIKNKLIRIKNGFVSTVTYGYRPRINEKPNLFNLEERNFIKKSIINVRQNHAILNILYTLILGAVISTAIFWSNSKIQKKQIILGKNRIEANNLGVNSQSIEAPTAFFLLKKADSVDPDNPTISQLAFDLFENGISNFNFLPTNIIPLKDELYNLSFDRKNNLLIVSNSNNYFQVNLSTGEIADLKKRSDLNFPDQPLGFVPKTLYTPEEGIIPFNRQGCFNETFYIVAPYLRPDSKFLMITPGSIRLSKFLGQHGFIMKDTCISKELKFTDDINYGYFLKDSMSVILICKNNSIFLADFENNRIIQFIKGYRMNQMAHFYTISDDGNKFAAVTNNKLIYVWDFQLSNPFKFDKTNSSQKILIDQKLQEALKYGDTILLDENGNKINIWLYNNANDYANIVAHNSSFDEFIVYQKLPDRYYVISKGSTIYKIQLPAIPNTDRLISINYSTDGESIFYSVYPDRILNDPSLQNDTTIPDSVLLQYPSLNKIKSWIRSQPALVSDTIP